VYGLAIFTWIVGTLPLHILVFVRYIYVEYQYIVNGQIQEYVPTLKGINYLSYIVDVWFTLRGRFLPFFFGGGM